MAKRSAAMFDRDRAKIRDVLENLANAPAHAALLGDFVMRRHARRLKRAYKYALGGKRNSTRDKRLEDSTCSYGRLTRRSGSRTPRGTPIGQPVVPPLPTRYSA